MTWIMSRFRAGDLVEVRSRREILGTLDRDGRLEGLPFMPEMLQYCGRRFHVDAVAHKTCETAHRTWQGRRLDACVHLGGLRCDGSAHGGCQALCTLFWKDAWLKKPGEATYGDRTPEPHGDEAATGCSEDRLMTATTVPSPDGGDVVRYSCQATRLLDATRPLAWWDPRQYLRDVTSGNRPLRDVARALLLAMLTLTFRHSPRGHRLLKALRERAHLRLTGRRVPDVKGTIALGESTPAGRLDLEAGEVVRIKSQADIEKTLNVVGKNRGLHLDVEMSPYCGRTATVRASVTRIIDEEHGHMVEMKQPCIILDGVVCRSEYSSCRLMCPRSIFPYWREIWLERVDAGDLPESDGSGA